MGSPSPQRWNERETYESSEPAVTLFDGSWRQAWSRAVRVLFLTYSLANGGLERQLSLLARSLPDHIERRMWSLEGGPHASTVAGAGVPLVVTSRRSRFDVTPAVRLWRLMRAWRPHVVHAWHWMPAAAAAPACVALGIPLIDGSIRMGSLPRSFGRPRRGIMRFATAVVANSTAGLAAWHIDPPKGRVIHNAFDDERLRMAGLPVSSSHGRSGRFTVVMAARMDPPKDFATVIQAARLLAAKHPGGWRFLLVGDGADRPALLSESAELRADGTITFPEGGMEVVGHMLSADVGLLMSDPAVLAEGCPNSIMEYMACGLPVVCADSGGCREVVSDGETGVVVPPCDAAALAAKLEWLRDHPERRASMGAAGVARVAADFSVSRFVRDYTRLYEEVAQRGRRGSWV